MPSSDVLKFHKYDVITSGVRFGDSQMLRILRPSDFMMFCEGEQEFNSGFLGECILL
jgi:hypothetical protein